MEEPAFLRRLRSNPSYGSDQARVIAPRNKKVKIDDDEDEPTYVFDGDALSAADFKALQAETEAAKGDKEKEGGNEEEKKVEEEEVKVLPKEKEAGIGGRKRKGGVVVGRDEDEELEDKVGEARKKAEELLGEGSKVKKGEEKEKVKPKLKAKGKKKKDAVKLNFGDDE